MSRPTHDRTDLHYGTEDDLVQLLSAAVGSISAGSSLHSALEYIHNEILFFENPPPPGPANQIFFDDFNRVVTRGLGGQWSLNPYDFHGSFTEDIKTSVNGFNVVVPAANFWEAWTGFPLPATGELYFDFYVPSSWTNPSGRPTYGIALDRSDYVGFYAIARPDGVSFWVYQFESDTPYVLTPTPSTWYRVHGRWDGSFVNLNVWRRIDPEPAGWQYTDTQRFLPYNPATDDAPFLDLYYFPAVDIGGVDNIRIITTESHWVGFGGFQVNSVIKKTASGSLSANSILRGNISGSKTADAVIKRNTTGSFTADAVIA